MSELLEKPVITTMETPRVLSARELTYMRIKQNMVYSSVEPAENYRTCPLDEAFNWKRIFAKIAEVHGEEPGEERYVFVFPSIRRPSLSPELEARFNEADLMSYDGAQHSRDFIAYWSGTPDAEGNCISFCIWKNREAALEVTGTEAHLGAVALARQVYSSMRMLKLNAHDPGGDADIVFRPIAA